MTIAINRSALIGAGVLAALTASEVAAKADIDPASYGVVATDDFGQFAVCSSGGSSNCTPSGPLSATASVLLPTADDIFSGSAAATVSAAPTPVLLVSASEAAAQLEEGSSSPQNFSAAASLTYFFELTSTPGSSFAGSTVPVLMNGFSSLTLQTGDEDNGTTSSVSLQIAAPDGTQLYGLPNQDGAPFSQVLMLTPGVEYSVTMGASVTVFVSANELQDEFESASATLDPTFTLDPSCDCDGDFQLAFSPNVGNGAATAPVPEPATWAIMLAGFGGLGAAMRRRALVAV